MHGERNERFAPHPCLQAISCSSIRPAHIFYPPLLGKIFCKLYYDKIRMIRLNPISMPTISPSTPGYGHQSGAFHLPRLAAGRGPTTDGNKENSAKFLSRLASPVLGVGDQAHLSFFFPSGFPFSHLGGQCLQFYAERGRRGERGKNQSAFVGLHQMDVGEGGREGEEASKRGRGRPRRGGARRGGGERPKSERGMHELKQRDRGSSSCSAPRCSTGCSNRRFRQSSARARGPSIFSHEIEIFSPARMRQNWPRPPC